MIWSQPIFLSLFPTISSLVTTGCSSNTLCTFLCFLYWKFPFPPISSYSNFAPSSRPSINAVYFAYMQTSWSLKSKLISPSSMELLYFLWTSTLYRVHCVCMCYKAWLSWELFCRQGEYLYLSIYHMHILDVWENVCWMQISLQIEYCLGWGFHYILPGLGQLKQYSGWSVFLTSRLGSFQLIFHATTPMIPLRQNANHVTFQF